MKKKVIIIGFGGHGRVIADIVNSGSDELEGFLDDNQNKDAYGCRYLGKTDDCVKFCDCSFIIGIGDNYLREKIAEKYSQLDFYTAISPSAVISDYAKVGKGTCVMPNCVINSGAEIGNHCIINTSAVVEHDCKIGDFVHVSPRAAIAGTVSVGARTHIGIGVSVRNNISICSDCIIGAGGAVVKDINKSGIYVGVPAKMKIQTIRSKP